MNMNRYHWAGLVGVLLVGSIIRIGPAMELPLWYDEADTWCASIDGAAQPMPYSRFFNWTAHFETAPLSFLLVRITTDLTGSTSEFTMRIPSLVLDILCIPAMFILGRVVHGPTLGLIAAAIAAFDPNLVDQSQQSRMYMVMLLPSILALAGAIALFRNPTRVNATGEHRLAWGRWLALGIAFGLCLWSQQFTLAVWVGIAIALVGLLALGKLTGQPHEKPAAVLGGFTFAYVVGLLLANIGVYRLVMRVFNGGPGDGEGLSYSYIGREVLVIAKDLIGWGWAGLIVYPLALIGFVLLLRKCKTSTAMLVGVVVMNVLMLFPFRKMHHFLDARYLTLAQPALFICLGMLVVGFKSRRLRAAGGVLITLILAAQLWRSTHLSAYYLHPDRYLFAPEIVHVRDQLKDRSGEAVFISPSAAISMADYYGLSIDRELYDGFFDPITTHPRKNQAVPEGFNAPAVWMVCGMNNHALRMETVRDDLAILAQHYKVEVDETELAQHLAEQRVTVLRVSREGIEMSSVGLNDKNAGE